MTLPDGREWTDGDEIHDLLDKLNWSGVLSGVFVSFISDYLVRIQKFAYERGTAAERKRVDELQKENAELVQQLTDATDLLSAKERNEVIRKMRARQYAAAVIKEEGAQ